VTDPEVIHAARKIIQARLGPLGICSMCTTLSLGVWSFEITWRRGHVRGGYHILSEPRTISGTSELGVLVGLLASLAIEEAAERQS